MWTRDHYRLDVPTPSTRAIDGIIDVCAHEGRCLLYHIPINPNAVRGFEDGLVDEFAEVRAEPRRRSQRSLPRLSCLR